MEIDQTRFDTIKNMFGVKAVQRVKYIQDQVGKIKQEDFTYTKLYMVNTLINKLIYKKDKVHWKRDHTATFLEFVTSGAGDSLDFAAAKYVTLVHIGFDKNRFKFFKTDTTGINKSKFDTQDYYVLGYTPKNSKEYVILDCYSDKIIPAFKENVKLKATQIDIKEKTRMIQEMLKINFIQKHYFVTVDTKKIEKLNFNLELELTKRVKKMIE